MMFAPLPIGFYPSYRYPCVHTIESDFNLGLPLNLRMDQYAVVAYPSHCYEIANYLIDPNYRYPRVSRLRCNETVM